MEKVELPIKTKIAAICMKVSGGLVALIGFAFFFLWIGAIIFIVMGGLLFLAGFFLLNKKRWAWKFAMIILIPGSVISLNFIQSILAGKFIWINLLPIPIVVSLILLLLDRKNFWKIAS